MTKELKTLRAAVSAAWKALKAIPEWEARENAWETVRKAWIAGTEDLSSSKEWKIYYDAEEAFEATPEFAALKQAEQAMSIAYKATLNTNKKEKKDE